MMREMLAFVEQNEESRRSFQTKVKTMTSRKMKSMEGVSTLRPRKRRLRNNRIWSVKNVLLIR